MAAVLLCLSLCPAGLARAQSTAANEGLDERVIAVLLPLGGETSGPACEAFSEHGFRGCEAETMRAIAAWITTGTVTPQVGRTAEAAE